MKDIIDFTEKMSIYELLALIISVVALIAPIINWAWKKWIKKAQLHYMSNGTATLFFNQSGSYLRIDGVYEAFIKAVSIKNISISVKRKRDDAKLNLSWSYFISPVNQNLVGNYVQTTEKAHPFRIEVDSIACAFIEFADPFDSAGKVFRLSTKELFAQVQQATVLYREYDEAVAAYRKTSEYAQAKNIIEKDFFWEIGKYDIVICTEFGKEKKEFCFSMFVDEESQKKLHENVDESLIAPLKKEYGVPWCFQNSTVEITEKN